MSGQFATAQIYGSIMKATLTCLMLVQTQCVETVRRTLNEQARHESPRPSPRRHTFVCLRKPHGRRAALPTARNRTSIDLEDGTCADAYLATRASNDDLQIESGDGRGREDARSTWAVQAGDHEIIGMRLEIVHALQDLALDVEGFSMRRYIDWVVANAREHLGIDLECAARPTRTWPTPTLRLCSTPTSFGVANDSDHARPKSPPVERSYFRNIESSPPRPAACRGPKADCRSSAACRMPSARCAA